MDSIRTEYYHSIQRRRRLILELRASTHLVNQRHSITLFLSENHCRIVIHLISQKIGVVRETSPLCGFNSHPRFFSARIPRTFYMFYLYLHFITLTRCLQLYGSCEPALRNDFDRDGKMKHYMLYFHIAPFCFWAFDVLTTLYAIDYLGVAEEMNPLGWPLGAWGALMFYIPSILFTYLLLFKIQNRYSNWIAALITVISLGLGVMNLLAGLHNIGVASLYI